LVTPGIPSWAGYWSQFLLCAPSYSLAQSTPVLAVDGNFEHLLKVEVRSKRVILAIARDVIRKRDTAEFGYTFSKTPTCFLII
jgi:hypothetical protein